MRLAPALVGNQGNNGSLGDNMLDKETNEKRAEVPPQINATYRQMLDQIGQLEAAIDELLEILKPPTLAACDLASNRSKNRRKAA
jgi:hypothetical protein